MKQFKFSVGLIVLLLVAACGGSEPPAPTPTPPTNPTPTPNPTPDPTPTPGPTPTPDPNPTPAPDGSSISGTLTAPAGGDVNGTIVIVCFIENDACNLDSPNTQVGVIQEAGASFDFIVEGFAAGSYIVEAFKDINANEELDSGDYYGCFGQDGDLCSTVQPGATAVTIQLQIEP